MSFLARTGLDRFNPAQAGAAGTRALATGLLVAMALLYACGRILEPRHPAFGYLRAFTEAAMVGGLADWFAVTALFRHPLGLPIPHTAIIPRNKDRIGDSLALFLRDNFLTPTVVARRMYRLDVAASLGRLLESPPQTGRLREGASQLVARVLEALDQDRLGGAVKSAAVARLRAARVAPLVGRALEAAIAENRHAPVLDAVIDWLAHTLDRNEELVRGMVSRRAGSLLRWTGLDERLGTTVLQQLDKLLAEMADDPHHPLRMKANEGLASLADRLQRDLGLQARVEVWKDELLANRAVGDWIDGLWEQARAGLLHAVRNPQTAIAGRFGEAIRGLGTTLQSDDRLRSSINTFARRAVVGAVASYGHAIVRLVSDTVRGWNPDTVTGRLEAAVGRDLQYIRINGTMVGGAVGLLLHLVDQLG
jgi:uncharacterized membrane-anchored protein YjiN (DUF445 family)